MKLGIAGLGWWGGTLVDAVEGSPNLKFVAAYTRSRSQQDQDIAAKHHLKLVDSFEAMLADLARGGRKLFDLESDPGEQRNLRKQRRELAESLQKELAAYYAAPTHQAPGRELPPDVEEKLRSLGYVK